MDNIELLYALLGTMLVFMMGTLVNRQLSRTPKYISKSPWGETSKIARNTDYFYTED